MIKKQAVIDFFNQCAPSWDAEMIRDDSIVSEILTNAGVAAGKAVLDVACGTGVLFPDYLQRGVNSLTAIDISPEMVHIAQDKFSSSRVQIICSDVETYNFASKFDVIMLYNAFPHFPDPERLIERLADLLNPGGCLSIAHGMSRAALDAHHFDNAAVVSLPLMAEADLAELMGHWLKVTTVISDDRMYQVCGTKEY